MEEKDWYEGSIDSVIIVRFMIEYDKRLKERKKEGKNRIDRIRTKKAGV